MSEYYPAVTRASYFSLSVRSKLSEQLRHLSGQLHFRREKKSLFAVKIPHIVHTPPNHIIYTYTWLPLSPQSTTGAGGEGGAAHCTLGAAGAGGGRGQRGRVPLPSVGAPEQRRAPRQHHLVQGWPCADCRWQDIHHRWGVSAVFIICTGMCMCLVWKDGPG